MKKESKIKAIGLTFALFCLNSLVLGIIGTLSPFIASTYVVSYSIVIIILTRMYKDEIKKDFKNLWKDIKESYKKVIPISLLFIGLVYVANYFIYGYAGTKAGNQISIEQELTSSIVLMLIYVLLLAPIVEEMIFKIPFKNHKEKRFIDFIIIVIMFTLIHFYPESNPKAYLYLISYGFLSISFAYPFYKTNNVLLSIIIHIINNLINVMVILF